MDIEFLSATELSKLIQSKQIGCLELLEHYIKRIEEYNPTINAIVSSSLHDARSRAIKHDYLLTQKRAVIHPLHGIPITVKEIFDIPGIPTTLGKGHLKDHFPKETSPEVQALLNDGVNILGKTNIPTDAIGWHSSNLLYGTTSNPWDINRTPGGSCGGGAAAVAAGLSVLDLGNDRVGSLRNPAHYCGVYSHKLSSVSGDMSTAGLLSRSANDLRLVVSLFDNSLLKAAKKTSIKDFRIAILPTCFLAEVDATIVENINTLGEFLQSEGAQVTQIESYPPPALLKLDYSIVQDTFFRLVHFIQPNISNAPGSGQPESEHWWKRNTTSAEARELMDTCDKMAKKMNEFFEDYDVLITPCAATVAPLHSEVNSSIRVNIKKQKVHYQKFWAGFASLFSLPSTTIPIGQAKGLPVGAQIIGPKFSDYSTIKLAQLLEEKYYKFQAPSGFGPLAE